MRTIGANLTNAVIGHGLSDRKCPDAWNDKICRQIVCVPKVRQSLRNSQRARKRRRLPNSAHSNMQDNTNAVCIPASSG